MLKKIAKKNRKINSKSVQSMANELCRYQGQIGASSDWGTYKAQELLDGYYVPMVLLFEQLGIGDEKAELRALFVEELYRYVDRFLPQSEQNIKILALLDFLFETYKSNFSHTNDLASVVSDIRSEIFSSGMVQKKPIVGVAVGDCLMTDLRTFLRPLSIREGVPCELHCLYFGAAQGGALPTDSVLKIMREQKADFLALSFFSYDGLPVYRLLKSGHRKLSSADVDLYISGAIAIVRDFIRNIRSASDMPIFLHNVSGLPLSREIRALNWLGFDHSLQKIIDKINAGIAELVDQLPNVIVVDESAVVRKHGGSACEQTIVPKSIREKAFFHRKRFGYYLSQVYIDLIAALSGLAKRKLILVDFDNTLWRGVMGDGEVDHYHERQQVLKDLKEQGIVLVAVSKNTASNIRWSEMLLKEDDFALLRINWNSKVQSVAEVAETLNLGVGSFVFLDDNPVEREVVRLGYPDVLCLDPNDIKTWEWLRWMFDFPCTSETDESKKRTEMYRSQAKRNVVLNELVADNEMIMRSLELRLVFRQANAKDIPRCCELAQRTNQFNTTTIRYSKDTIVNIMAGGGTRKIYVGELSDKFGDLGVVVMAVICFSSDGYVIENFVMSCRAMGFGLEQKFVGELISISNPEVIWQGNFVSSERNGPAADLFSNSGFFQEEVGRWVLEDRFRLNSGPDWFLVDKSS
ncbi:MAG: HAD-IIIC family phosphatase [Dechloromonas sp.]|nr:HAD-IIIC family phosphatase [Dechloromonas sp.]